MDGASSGFVSGAAQGAVAGSAFGVPGAVVGGVVGGVVGWIGGSAADDAQANQQAWADYNSRVQYNTDLKNLGLTIDLGEFNAGLADLEGELNAQNIEYTAKVNAELVEATTAYNDLLYENDLTATWNAFGLDTMTIENQRALERGTLRATQGASGTVIGEGSNADAEVYQRTQEIMDKMVVRYNADLQAANIANAQAQSMWDGQMAAETIRWEGEMAALSTRQSASLQAYSIQGQTVLTGIGGYQSAGSGLTASQANSAIAASNYSQSNTNSMVSGLFSAAGTAASSYDFGGGGTSTQTSSIASNSGSSGATTATVAQIGTYS